MVSLRANHPEGMLFLSNSTSSFKSAMATPAAGIILGRLAAGFSETYGKIMPAVRAKQENKESDLKNRSLFCLLMS